VNIKSAAFILLAVLVAFGVRDYAEQGETGLAVMCVVLVILDLAYAKKYWKKKQIKGEDK